MTSVSSLVVGEGALNRMPLWPTHVRCLLATGFLSLLYALLFSLLSPLFSSLLSSLLSSILSLLFSSLLSSPLTSPVVSFPLLSFHLSFCHDCSSLVLGCSARSAREQTLVSASFYMKPKNFEEFRAEVPHLSWFKTQRKGLGYEAWVTPR